MVGQVKPMYSNLIIFCGSVGCKTHFRDCLLRSAWRKKQKNGIIDSFPQYLFIMLSPRQYNNYNKQLEYQPKQTGLEDDYSLQMKEYFILKMV